MIEANFLFTFSPKSYCAIKFLFADIFSTNLRTSENFWILKPRLVVLLPSLISTYMQHTTLQHASIYRSLSQGRIQDFLKGGSESGVDIEGGANLSIVSLKQGVWGAQMQDCSVFKLNL